MKGNKDAVKIRRERIIISVGLGTPLPSGEGGGGGVKKRFVFNMFCFMII